MTPQENTKPLILQKRRCGNSTRQIDQWIQDLFTNGKAVIIDHAHQENRGVAVNFANRHSRKILLERLWREHSIDPKEDLVYDPITYTLSFREI
jgi:hypothetical protein